MTIEQTVEIDRDRRILRLDQPLPETVSAGRNTITLIFPDGTGSAPDHIEVPAKCGMKPESAEPTWDELHAEARAKTQYYKDHPFVSLRAEGLEKRSREQIRAEAIAEVRALRDEWDD